MDCELTKRISPRILYAVIVESMIIPPAFFICQHCAEAWAKETFIDGFTIVPLSDSQFVGDLFDEMVTIGMVRDFRNMATGGALQKHDLES